MHRLIDEIKRWFGALPPNSYLVALLAAWWVVNILQAAFTGLADDEAYYYMFAQGLGWGYYDHPPLTGVMVWMGNFIGGTLGVRFFFIICQPIYLYMLWALIRKPNYTRQDALLYFLITASIPILFLYGLVAVPDVPLMLFTAVFLLCYKRFTENESWANSLLLGLSMALLAYSKYQGALVVLFTLISNPALLKKPRFYAAGLLTLVLYLPHLVWQGQHDWVSFKYHLSERNKVFKISYPFEFIANLIAVFNPLYFPVYIAAFWKLRSKTPLERAMSFILAGFIVFFLFSSLRGHVQPQWVIPVSFTLVALLFQYSRARGRQKLRKYVTVSAWVTIGLIILLRVEMIFNPIGLRFEIFNNKATYSAIEEIAGDRTVIFAGSYARAAKYNFYTGKPAYGQPHVGYRSSHWQFRDDDTRAAGSSVVIETSPEKGDSTVMLADGRTFSYRVMDDFRPVRNVDITVRGGLPDQLRRGETFTYRLRIDNPYPYPVVISPDSLPVTLVMRDIRRNLHTFPQAGIRGKVWPGESALFMDSFVIPADIPAGDYTMGFTIATPDMGYWYNSPYKNVRIR